MGGGAGGGGGAGSGVGGALEMKHGQDYLQRSYLDAGRFEGQRRKLTLENEHTEDEDDDEILEVGLSITIFNILYCCQNNKIVTSQRFLP